MHMTPHDLRCRRRALTFALALAGVARGALAQAPAGAPPVTPPAAASARVGAPAPGVPAEKAATAGEAGASVPREVELRRRGMRAWSEGRYADALVDFEEAVALSPDPRLFFNLAVTYEKLGRYAEALRWLTRFQSEASRDELAQVSELPTRVAVLRNRVSVLKVNVNVPGARVLVRDAVVGAKPPDRPLEVSLNAGRALVEIMGEGYRPYYKEHMLPGGGSLELAVELNRQAAPVTVVEKKTFYQVHSTPFWSQWWFWAGAGALVVGGAVTVYALSTEKSPRTPEGGNGPFSTALPSNLGLRF
jgi:tetratricopeptide (TPR) repeat protein